MRFRAHPRSTGSAVTLLVGVAAFLFMCAPVASHGLEATSTVALDDATVQAIAQAVASEITSQPLDVVVTDMPEVQLGTSVSVDGTLPVSVDSVGGVTTPQLAAILGLLVLSVAVVTIAGVVR